MSAVSTSDASVLTYSRDELLRLGTAGRSWEFLALAMPVIEAEPDEDLRLMAAANATMLGLGTMARSLLEAMPARRLKRSDVRSMLAALEALEPDEITAPARLSALEANVGALAARGIDLTSEAVRWREMDASRVWYRASDGNVVRRRSGSWERIGDQAGSARRFVQTHLIEGGDAGRPLTIEGVDPPWLLIEAHRATPVAADGFQPRLTVLQADPMELLDGLAHEDMSALLGESRVEIFVGAEAMSRYAQVLRDRFETQVIGAYVPLNGTRTRLDPPGETVLREAEASQRAEHVSLLEEIRARYEGRDASWWAARYASARSGGPALRVLVPTCRYSTFIRHSSADLVSALRGAGCEAELLIEPDDSSRFSSLAYLRAIRRFEPDLVILINYTRAHLGDLFPASLPFVCWMQDAMSHHYDASIGARQTAMDFLVGHLGHELFEQFGFPRERSMRMPVVTSTRTFHPGPVAPAVQRRYECEIGWVSHHSETPEAMHERLKQEIGPVVSQARGAPDEQVVTQLFRLYAKPLADRVLRHQTLSWAADIADRRSWRLQVHGRGWEAHPRFRRHACGEVSHDEALRACYAGASVQLHMTINDVVHQRIMECALSGGLPACRLNAATVGPVMRALRQEASRAEPVARESRNGSAMVGFDVAGTEASSALATMLRACGVEVPDVMWVEEGKVERLREQAPPPPERRADWLLGDLSEMTFSTARGLEALIERAMGDESWRRERSAFVAERVRERLTDDVLVERVLELVTHSMGVEA